MCDQQTTIKTQQQTMTLFQRLGLTVFCCAALLVSSCTSLLTTTIIEPSIGNLQQQTDLELVCEGAPAYLLMIDSLLVDSPRSAKALQAGAQIYVGAITAMAACGTKRDRLKTLAEKAKNYGTRLISLYLPTDQQSTLQKALKKLQKKDAAPVFWGALAWLTWVQQQQGTPAAMADLGDIEQIMARLLILDPGCHYGGPHLFWAGYYASKPAAFGGDPEKSKQHFQKALALSKRQFLLVQTTYAETLARQLFDRELHDKLLEEVLNFPLDAAPQHSLSNQIAKRKARRLLDEKFFE